MTVSLTYDPVLFRVRIDANGLAAADVALVEQSTDQVTWSTVRGGMAVPVTLGVMSTLDDYEFADATPNYYRVRGIETPNIGYVGAGSISAGNNASVTPGFPAGLAHGDLMVAWASIRNTGVGTVNVPTGWTLLRSVGGAALMGRIFQTGDVAPTITFSGGVLNADTIGQIAAWRRASITPLANARFFNISAQDINYPALPVTVDRCLIIYAGWKQDDWTSVATLAGATEIGEFASGAGDDAGQVWDFQVQTNAVNIPAGSFVVTGGLPALSNSIVIAIPHADFLNEQTGYSPPLNTNPYFETTASPWTGLGGTVARSTAQFHEGVASLLLTPDGVSALAEARAELVPVTAGLTYRASCWARCAVARNINCNINWHTAAGVLISTSTTTVAVEATTWTLLELTATAPIGAAQARLIPVSMGGTPPAGNTVHLDEAALSQLGITPVLDGVILKSLARPFLNRKVVVTDWSDVERASRSGVFPIVGRSMPVAVTDLHGSRQWTLDVAAQTAQEAQALDLLISTGEVQFVHVPAAERVPGGYVALGDTSERRPRPRAIRRIISMPLTECAAPGPDVIPAVGTWQSVINSYASWNAVLAAHADWNDLLQLVGSPADVVVP